MKKINFSKHQLFEFNLLKYDRKKFFLFLIYSVFSLGIFNLFVYWHKSYYLWVTKITNDINEATHVKIVLAKNKSISVKQIKRDVL